MTSVPTERPPRATSATIVLADARGAHERRLVGAWAAAEHPGAEVLDLDDPTLARRLLDGDDPRLIPARVAWLPPEEAGDLRARPRVRDLLLLADPGGRLGRAQQLVARARPQRARVVAGEGARAQDLRRECVAETDRDDAETLGPFVARRAALANDRAERAVIGDRYKVPRLVAEQIVAGRGFNERLHALAGRLDRPVDEVRAEAQAGLEELVTVQSRLGEELYRQILGPFHQRAWSVNVDTDGLERLRELNRTKPLVFLPSHRAYVDPLVFNEVLHAHGFPRNHMLGGDNMAFWPIGPLGRRSGAIFIRRSFGKDEVYKQVVREYLAHLLSKRFNLEWYPEGGRTRTGKLRPPRLGLLHYLVQGMEIATADDVLLVPMSIAYDRQHEVRKVVAEQLGATKSAEGLQWFAEYMHSQRRRAGDAFVTFGEAFSLREAMADAGEGRLQLEKVAFRVLNGINRVTPVTPTALLTFALLGVRDRALTLDEVRRITVPLLDAIERRGTPNHVAALREPQSLRAVLNDLVDDGMLTCYQGGTEAVWSIARDGHHVAAFYRNGVLHHLLNRAILEVGLLRVASRPDGRDPREQLWDSALRLRDLLKFEFFFAERDEFRDQIAAEAEQLDPDWREKIDSPSAAAELLSGSRTLVAHRALRSFLDAQLVVADRLAARGADATEPDRDAFMAECQGYAKQLVLQGRLHGSESNSRELFAAALKLADNRGALTGDDVAARRRAWCTELHDELEVLARIGDLDRMLTEEALGDD